MTRSTVEENIMHQVDGHKRLNLFQFITNQNYGQYMFAIFTSNMFDICGA